MNSASGLSELEAAPEGRRKIGKGVRRRAQGSGLKVQGARLKVPRFAFQASQGRQGLRHRAQGIWCRTEVF
jgi:hypothetical protein